MSQVTSESILTTKSIVEQAIKDYHKQILPYLNGKFPTAVVEKFAEGNIYTTDEKIIGQWVDGKPLYQCVFPPNSHVPVITSNDARIIKSSQHSEQYAAWHVYDGDATTSWDPGANNGRIGWDFQSAVSVLKFKFGMTRPSNYPVTKIDLCYSDDASNWTVVHSYIMNTDYPNTDEINEFTVQKEVGEHRYWSLYAYCANGWAELHTVDFICIEMPSNTELIITKDLANGNIIGQYTKVGDDPINIGSITDYSTIEKIVGTWIDGKPLYQKVTSESEVIENIDLIINKATLGGVDAFTLTQDKEANGILNKVRIIDATTKNIVYSRDFSCSAYGVYSEVLDTFEYNGKTYNISSEGTTNRSKQSRVSVYRDGVLLCENWSVCKNGDNTSYPSSGEATFKSSVDGDKYIIDYTKTTD